MTADEERDSEPPSENEEGTKKTWALNDFLERLERRERAIAILSTLVPLCSRSFLEYRRSSFGRRPRI